MDIWVGCFGTGDSSSPRVGSSKRIHPSANTQACIYYHALHELVGRSQGSLAVHLRVTSRHQQTRSSTWAAGGRLGGTSFTRTLLCQWRFAASVNLSRHLLEASSKEESYACGKGRLQDIRAAARRSRIGRISIGGPVLSPCGCPSAAPRGRASVSATREAGLSADWAIEGRRSRAQARVKGNS